MKQLQILCLKFKHVVFKFIEMTFIGQVIK